MHEFISGLCILGHFQHSGHFLDDPASIEIVLVFHAVKIIFRCRDYHCNHHCPFSIFDSTR